MLIYLGQFRKEVSHFHSKAHNRGAICWHPLHWEVELKYDQSLWTSHRTGQLTVTTVFRVGVWWLDMLKVVLVISWIFTLGRIWLGQILLSTSRPDFFRIPLFGKSRLKSPSRQSANRKPTTTKTSTKWPDLHRQLSIGAPWSEHSFCYDILLLTFI